MPAAILKHILALDLGGKRVGVAIASTAARLPRPLTTLVHDDKLWDNLAELVRQEEVDEIVLGWPRGLQGQQTAQTRYSEAFREELVNKLNLPVHFQDEALTSKRAETELAARGKPYSRGDVDALAAVYILDDYLSTHGEAV